MINNCSSLLLLVALLSYNNNCCTPQTNCGCNNCNYSNGISQTNNCTSLGMDAGMLCLLLAFLTCGCNSNNSSC